MGRVLFFVLFACIFAIEAKTDAKEAHKKHRSIQRSEYDTESCVPGKFYQGPGCSNCYCNVNKTMLCGSLGTCKLSDLAPTKSELIHTFSKAELYKLPSLPSQGSECNPGESYRVDCNRCICHQTRGLTCEDLLCPSYDDVNRLKATEMSGKPCDSNVEIEQDCIECSCRNNSVACEAQRDCLPPEVRAGKRKAKGKKKYRHKDDTKLTNENQKYRGTCEPGKKYYRKNKNNKKIKCHCRLNGMLICPKEAEQKTLKGKSEYIIQDLDGKECRRDKNYYKKVGDTMYLCYCSHNDNLICPRLLRKQKERPFDEAFLDPSSKKKCTPGVLYRRECNRCTCTKKRYLRCTSMECINPKVVQALKKRRQKLEKQD